jgi:hypothetical protein
MTVGGFTWSLCLAALIVFMNVGLSPSML